MLELKLVNGLARLYRAGLRLSLKSLNARDKAALKKYNRQLEYSTELHQFSLDVARESEAVADKANAEYGAKQRLINDNYNHLANRLDDISIQ